MGAGLPLLLRVLLVPVWAHTGESIRLQWGRWFPELRKHAEFQVLLFRSFLDLRSGRRLLGRTRLVGSLLRVSREPPFYEGLLSRPCGGTRPRHWKAAAALAEEVPSRAPESPCPSSGLCVGQKGPQTQGVLESRHTSWSPPQAQAVSVGDAVPISLWLAPHLFSHLPPPGPSLWSC